MTPPYIDRSLVEKANRKWPIDPLRDGAINVQQRLHMQYIGALTVLGRAVRHVPADSDLLQWPGIPEVFVDANIWLRLQGSDMRYEWASGSQISAFEGYRVPAVPPALPPAPEQVISVLERMAEAVPDHQTQSYLNMAIRRQQMVAKGGRR